VFCAALWRPYILILQILENPSACLHDAAENFFPGGASAWRVQVCIGLWLRGQIGQVENIAFSQGVPVSGQKLCVKQWTLYETIDVSVRLLRESLEGLF